MNTVHQPTMYIFLVLAKPAHETDHTAEQPHRLRHFLVHFAQSHDNCLHIRTRQHYLRYSIKN